MATYTTSYKEAVHSNRLETPDATSPFNWLRDGWRDFTGAPLTSLMLGAAFTFICAAAYAAATHLPMFSVSFLTLVLFAGPFLATMAYAVARQRVVRLGARTGSRFEILEGLAEGDRIVVRGQHGLRDGQQVEVVSEPEGG